MNAHLACLALACLALPLQDEELSPFQETLRTARAALERGELERAHTWVWRALERDPKSLEAWDLRASWAEAAGDEDEAVYALYRLLELSLAQGLRGNDLRKLRQRLTTIDPLAAELLSMRSFFIDKLLPIAVDYEKDERPHSAIATYREILALDGEHLESLAAIQRISSLPDPSLAADSSGTDLFEGVSDEWIRKHDRKHPDWGKRAKFKGEHYTVYSDAGYKVLIQAATAMDQMHLFYKEFFGVDGSISRIDLNIFKSREEYLKKGAGPPVEWSGGHFTGSAVEVYVGGGGFQSTLSTLFHEAAHQFVNRATSAGGWLNEGLASFFEGTRLQANGTVLMNFPAMHRLGPLARRLDRGWMEDEKDGTDAQDPNKTPIVAPTFGIILENKYAWGPAWYAPTWGVVFFAYNYQDPVDGRFIYRKSFLEFLNKSGGRTGDSAVSNFEKVVLANPARPTPGMESSIALPETVAELNDIWKRWLQNLMNEQLGTVEVNRPYGDWGRHAIRRKEYVTAGEHFEKGLAEDPDDSELLVNYAELLAGKLDNEDRAVKLIIRALRTLESAEKPDRIAIKQAEELLYDWDPERKSLDKVHKEIHSTARTLIQRYLTEGRNLMTMHLASQWGNELNVSGVMQYYEEAWRRSGKSLHLWKLAYNESNLEGWSAPPTTPFAATGQFLDSNNGVYAANDFSYTTLPMDLVTTGDYSIEAEVLATSGKVGFGGLVFGMSGGTNFNALIFLPGKGASGAVSGSAFLDLVTFNGGGQPRVWRHIPAIRKLVEGESTAERWNHLRLDVTGTTCDVYLDGQLKVVHEFPSRDSVNGSLGLISGAGTARFRNVRYLSRSPRDLGARLEREAKMKDYGAEDKSIGGSWLAKKAPFPVVLKWVKNERKDWREAGPVPQLLVMWSIRQNDLIRIDQWLNWLEYKFADVGLQVLSVCDVSDKETAEAYMSKHKFPGSVAIDGIGGKLGDTFDAYELSNFNLPRLILLDIDGRVVWEGDPGFKVGSRWTAGKQSFLDAPLEELVIGRNLRELAGWRKNWKGVAIEALHDANLEQALPILANAEKFKPRGDQDVFEAQSRFAAIKGAMESIETTLKSLDRDGCGASAPILMDWGRLIGHDFDKQTAKTVKSLLRSDGSREWDKVLDYLKQHKRRRRQMGAESATEALRAELASKKGRLPALLLESLADMDPDEVGDAIKDVSHIPGLWLAREYFRW